MGYVDGSAAEKKADSLIYQSNTEELALLVANIENKSSLITVLRPVHWKARCETSVLVSARAISQVEVIIYGKVVRNIACATEKVGMRIYREWSL